MTTPSPQDVTQLLQAWSDGDPEALGKLTPLVYSKIDPRENQLVELRCFGGLSVEETAEVLKISPRTALREWSLAQTWLYRELSQEEKHDA